MSEPSAVEVIEVLAALKAAGFVVATRDAIRAMSPSEQAELIGGDVGYWSLYENGTPYSHIQPFTDVATKQVTPPHVIAAYLMRGGTKVSQRVVGPWREVQP